MAVKQEEDSLNRAADLMNALGIVVDNIFVLLHLSFQQFRQFFEGERLQIGTGGSVFQAMRLLVQRTEQHDDAVVVARIVGGQFGKQRLLQHAVKLIALEFAHLAVIMKRAQMHLVNPCLEIAANRGISFPFRVVASIFRLLGYSGRIDRGRRCNRRKSAVRRARSRDRRPGNG